jgi:hypothetical protein
VATLMRLNMKESCLSLVAGGVTILGGETIYVGVEAVDAPPPRCARTRDLRGRQRDEWQYHFRV